MKLKYILEKINNEYTIYCDIDGVLSDFVKAFKKISNGVHPDKYEDDNGEKKFFALIHDNGIDWWSGMEWMPNAKALWAYLKPYNPTILSAPSKNPISKKGKKLWVAKNVGNVPAIYVPRKDKAKNAKHNAILIDDNAKTCKEWKSKGGIAIHHTSVSDTLKKLKAIIE